MTFNRSAPVTRTLNSLLPVSPILFVAKRRVADLEGFSVCEFEELFFSLLFLSCGDSNTQPFHSSGDHHSHLIIPPISSTLSPLHPTTPSPKPLFVIQTNSSSRNFFICNGPMSSIHGGGSIYGGGAGSVHENSTIATFSSRNSLTNTTTRNKLENLKINGTLDLLRKEISLPVTSSKNENIVMKEEQIEVNGKEIIVHRVYMLYGAYRVGWILDEDIHSCMECQVEFNFLTRRHHCRACGNIICSNCSPYKATIPTLDELNGSRVCVNCFGLKVNLNNLRHYANLEEFDSFETISSHSDDHDHASSSVYSGGMISSANNVGQSPIERDLRQQAQLQHKREQKALSRQKLIEASRKPQYLRAYR